jgi:carbonic anhydrase
MRLLEAIVDANQRAARGDTSAGLHLPDFTDALPLVALTCIDPRLNPLLPGALGLPEDQFVWLRNAGNIITGPMSSTMRSLALACAIKGGREIAVIGHSDCRVRQTSVLDLTGKFNALGVPRDRLPDNLNEFFGLFASERHNVIRSVEFIRSSPLVGPKVPVHGLLMEVQSGALEWIVNGYQALDTVASRFTSAVQREETSPPTMAPEAFAAFALGEMKFPETRIGDPQVEAHKWLSEVQTPPPAPAEVTATTKPPPPAPKYGQPRPKAVPPPLTADLIQPWRKHRKP